MRNRALILLLLFVALLVNAERYRAIGYLHEQQSDRTETMIDRVHDFVVSYARVQPKADLSSYARQIVPDYLQFRLQLIAGNPVSRYVRPLKATGDTHVGYYIFALHRIRI